MPIVTIAGLGAAMLFVLYALLHELVAEMIKKSDVLREVVQASIKSMVEGVTQNGSWRGDGADRFVAEMTNEVLPLVEKIIYFLLMASEQAKSAQSDIDEADKSASQTAVSLGQDFKNVYTA